MKKLFSLVFAFIIVFSFCINLFAEGETGYEIEIQTLPDKLTYEYGEKLDLKGLTVHITVPDGYIASSDGDRLSYSKEALTTPGKQKVTIGYETAKATFEITVKEHKHVFSDWVDKKSADCTDGGIKERKCECGEVETKIVPPLGHDWKVIKIIAEPTEKTEGEAYVRCSRCNSDGICPVKSDGTIDYDRVKPASETVPTEAVKTTEVPASVAEKSEIPEKAEVPEKTDNGLVIGVFVTFLVLVIVIIVLVILILKKNKKQ